MKKLFLFSLTIFAVSTLITGCFENKLNDIKSKFSKPKAKYMVIDLPSGEVNYMDNEPPGGWSDIYKTVKLVLRRIEPGTFIMGSPVSELGRLGRNDYETQHEVTITKPFYIGIFEITQKQYKLIYNPPFIPPFNRFKGDTKPADSVSYEDIRGRDKGASWPRNDKVDDYSFLGKLRARLKMKFDLPTEAQWEYACRAGTTTALNNGTNLSSIDTDNNLDNLGLYAGNGGYDRGKSKGPTDVGSFRPNSWGLYDMHGNVWEWCLDWYDSYDGDATYPKRREHEYDNCRVLRGGGWHDHARHCRSATRAKTNPGTHGVHLEGPGYGYYSGNGFRVVLVQ